MIRYYVYTGDKDNKVLEVRRTDKRVAEQDVEILNWLRHGAALVEGVDE